MNSIFMDTLQGKATSRPPIWFMRQAGRILPGYQKLRQQHSFQQLMNEPDLCAEVTLMPVRDLDVDAAILFSDILVIPTAMGEEICWTEKGPVFPHPLAQYQEPTKMLNPDSSKLDYIYRNIDRIVERKDADTPLIGFCGAPLTTMCYMLQGISTKADFPEATRFFYQNREETLKLRDAVTELSMEYALKQVEHGIDAFQIFETHAGLLPEGMYRELFLPAVEKIGKAVKDKGVPVIFFAKGIGAGLREISKEYCDMVSIDWQTDIWKAREMTDSSIGLQGNLDPRLLYASQDRIRKELDRYSDFYRENKKWIFNLGHGVIADAPLGNLEFIVRWVKEHEWR